MKKISNRDAHRILMHLEKAQAILDAAENASDTGEIGILGDIMQLLADAMGGLEYSLNGTVWLEKGE